MKKLNHLAVLIVTMFTILWFISWTADAEDGLAVTIFTPTNAEITWNDNILFSFEGSYPDTHSFTNYQYEIKRVRDSSTIKQWIITESWFQSFTENLEDWMYTFAVTLNTTNEWFSPYKKESRWFTVVDDVTLSITTPRNNQIINDTSQVFSRDWQANTFDYYEYEIKNSDWSYYYSWKSYNIDEKSINRNDLKDWSYAFTVKMYYNGWEHYLEDINNFTVRLPSSLEIYHPTLNENVDSKAYTFSRYWTHPYFAWYCYKLSSSNWYPSKSECPTLNESLTVNDLVDGDYTLRVSMVDNSNNELDYRTRDFYVALNRSLSIDPIPTITSKNYTFSRNWYAEDFIKYNYTLTNSDSSYSTWWSTTESSFSVSNLKDGTYTLTVELVYEWWILTPPQTKTFTVDINKALSVNSNPNGTITRNNVTWVDVTVNREWDNDWFSWYKYRLVKDGITKDEWTSSNKSDLKIYKNLPSWTYTFYVDMLNWSEIITSNHTTFTIVIPTTLDVVSPLAWLQNSNNITFKRNWFAEYFDHYEYTLNRIDWGTTTDWGIMLIKSWTWNASFTWFQINWLHHWEYEFIISIKSSSNETLKEVTRTFQLLDDVALINSISSNNSEISEWWTISSKSATFSWSWKSEDFAWYYYSIIWTTFSGWTYNYTWTELWKNQWSITLSNLQTWKYKFTIAMIDSDWNTITSNEKNFNVVIPATLTITSPSEWATITSSNTTFSWTGYSDVIEKYWYALTYWDQPVDTNNFTNNTKITSPTLKNWNYTLTVWIISWVNVAQDTIHFTVAIPVKTSWWSSSKTHYNNNLKLSLWNDSPSANEWIKLVVKIDDKYTWKVSFPKLQYYSPDTEKWIDIPITSKNYVSDYSDDAKLGYIKFSSSDDWRKDLEEFIKFSKNWYYRIYAEDKDWYDDYIEFQVSNKKASTNQTTATNTQNNTTVSNTPNNIDSVINQFMPEVLEQKDTSEEVYIARSCKKYTIVYSDSLNIYTSPNLNISEFFMNKAYLKRYLDSKNKYQSGCPTNIWWISTSYIDRTEDNTRYTAPNGKVYFIIGQEWNYYSNELNRELKTPTSFKTIQELKYYIRDRNPLINMATLWPVN